MPASFRALGPITNGVDSSTIIATIQIPSGAVAGDLLLLVLTSFNHTNNDPGGWEYVTEVTSNWNSPSDGPLTQKIYKRVCQPGDPGSTFQVRYNNDPQSNMRSYVVAYSGVLNGTIKAFSNAATTNATQNMPLSVGGHSFTRRGLPVQIGANFQRSGSGANIDSEIDRIVGNNFGLVTIALGDDNLRAGSSPGHTITGTGSFDKFVLTNMVLDSNDPPTTPGAFSSPTAAQTVNNSVQATWGASSDPDGDGVSYGLDLTRDNGATWNRVYTGGATSVTLDVSAVAATTAARFRVFASDGHVATGFTESPTFTIEHNNPPTAPTNLNPDGNRTFDRNTPQRFSWQFNDPNAGDAQSAYVIRARIVGTSAWSDTGVVQSPSSFRDFPAGNFTVGQWEWQVSTADSTGAGSPWSASAFFTAANLPPGPTIVSPLNGATISTSSGIIEWSYNNQTAYQVRKVADSGGNPDTATVYFDTGIVNSATTRTVALTYPTNNRFEHLQVRVQDSSSGLWSPYSSVRVQVSFTPPATPTVSAAVQNATASIRLSIANPTPTGTQPTVTSSDVFRRVGTTGDGIRIARGVADTYTDRTPGHGIDYRYRVQAQGANGTSVFSAWTTS